MTVLLNGIQKVFDALLQSAASPQNVRETALFCSSVNGFPFDGRSLDVVNVARQKPHICRQQIIPALILKP